MNDIYGTPRGESVALGYQATEAIGRRQPPRTKAHHEDLVAKPLVRKQLEETATDQVRNYAIAAWIIRRHLDYVSQFVPQVQTTDKDLNLFVKRLLKRMGKRRNFDVAKRFSRDQAMRFFELSKVADGDSMFALIKGGKKQLIEGRMIGMPSDLETIPKRKRKLLEGARHGIIKDPVTEEMKAACILKFDSQGRNKVFGQIIDEANFVFDGYFNRVNTTRGVSPLSTAINLVADLSEVLEATVVKAKIHAMFGVAITRDMTEFDEGGYDPEEDDEDNVPSSGSQEIDFSKGAAILNLDPGEKTQTIESATPNATLMPFSELLIRLAMLSLDIPFTGFDSTKASYSARIADQNEYEYSARQKRIKNQEVLDELTEWDVRNWVDDESTGLAAELDRAGISADELIDSISWEPIGTPWLDKLKEVLGDERAIAIGLESTPRAARRRGVDAYDILEEEAEYQEAARQLGVPRVVGVPGQQTVEEKRTIEDASTSEQDPA